MLIFVIYSILFFQEFLNSLLVLTSMLTVMTFHKNEYSENINYITLNIE